MRLRRSLFLLYALFALGPPMLLAQAQRQGTITSTQCVPIDVSAQSTVGIQVTGTWTGTLQPKISIQGQSPQNVQVTPSTSSTAQSTITANGIYRASVAAGTTFLLCGNTVASGTAYVYLNSSTANLSARDAVGGTIDPGTVNLLGKYSSATSIGPSGITDDGTTVSAAEILQFGNAACSSLDAITTTTTGCSAARNWFLTISSGSTATNFNRSLNVYFQTDGHNVSDTFGQQIASALLVDAGTQIQTHYGLDVYAAVSGNAVTGMELRAINARPRIFNGAHLSKMVYFHGTTASVICSTCTIDVAYGVDLGMGTVAGGVVTESIGYGMNNTDFRYGAQLGGSQKALLLTDSNGVNTSGGCHAAINATTAPVTAIHDCWFGGTGSPEGVVTGNIGSHFSRQDGGAGTSFYIKESGSGNTGWASALTSLSGGLPVIQGITTAGLGVPVQTARVRAVSQVAAIGSTTLFATGGATADYLVVGTLYCDATSAGATVSLSIGYTDSGSQAQTIAPSAATCTALGSSSFALINSPIVAKNGTNITYSTSIANTPTYDLRLDLYQLGSN